MFRSASLQNGEYWEKVREVVEGLEVIAPLFKAASTEGVEGGREGRKAQ